MEPAPEALESLSVRRAGAVQHKNAARFRRQVARQDVILEGNSKLPNHRLISPLFTCPSSSL